MSAKAEVTMEGTVQKVIESKHPDIPEKAEIAIDDCEELYREIRIPNILKDDKGNEAKLKEGAQVEVTVEADSKDTIAKNDDDSRRKPEE